MSDRERDDGFAIADRDTGTLRDSKLVRAFRRLGLAAVVAWDALVDASWEKGCRVPLEDALLPLPYGLDPDAIGPVFAEVGLTDADGRITEESWGRWFGPAFERREKRRQSGAIGGRRSRSGVAQPKRKRRLGDAVATLEERSGDAEPDRPSDRPTDTPSVQRVNETVVVADSARVPDVRAARGPVDPLEDHPCRVCGHRMVEARPGRWVCTNAPGHGGAVGVSA